MSPAAEPSRAGTPEARLLPSAGNPVPEWGRAGYLEAPRRPRLRYGLFPARAHPQKGTVLLLAGRNECIEKYFETIGDLCRRGFTVAILDWRGQGGSTRQLRNAQRGHVTSFDDYLDDLDRFFDGVVSRETRPPYYFLGHSTGALIALLAAPRYVDRVRRMVLCGPLLSFESLPVSTRALKRIAGFFRAIGLGWLYLGPGGRPAQPMAFAANRLTSDAARYLRNVEMYREHPQLALGGPTATWLHAACRAIDTVTDPDFVARIQIPALFIAAGADEVVSNRAIEALARRLRSASVLTVDGARHELLQEADIYREQVLAAFDAFVPGTDGALSERGDTGETRIDPGG